MPKLLSVSPALAKEDAPAEQRMDGLLRAKAKEIYSILTKRDIRRAQPDTAKVEGAIFASLKEDRRVEFTVLWGGFKEGPTGKADAYDAMALDRISDVTKEIQSVLNTIPDEDGCTREVSHGDSFPPGRWTRHRWHIKEYYVKPNILFCDMHHRLASGVAEERCMTYFKSMETEANKRSICIERLSRHYTRAYEHQKAYEPWYVKMASWFSFGPSECEFYSVFTTESITKRCEELCRDARFMSELLPMAMRHSKLYSKGMSLTSVAKAYIEVELGFLESMRKELGRDHIFVSYSKPTVQGPMFGGIPAVYWYATKRGDSRVPCFMHDGEETSVDVTQAGAVSDRPGINYRKYVFVKKVLKFVMAAALNVGAMLYLSGNYAIPYTLYASTEIGGMMAESSGRWRAFRDKYYMKVDAKPTWTEFLDATNGTERQIYDACRFLHIPTPEYVMTASGNRDKLLQVRDAKSDDAKRLVAEGTKLLEMGVSNHEERVFPMSRQNTGGAMTLLLKAHDLEPDSIEIVAQISRVAENLDHSETSRFWLIQANAMYLGMYR